MAAGAVFSIHVGDQATVSDVLWEDIYVEHFWELLIDFRIFESRYSKDPDRGHVRNVTLRRVHTIHDPYNIPSLIGGYAVGHLVENVRIEGCTIGDRRVLNARTTCICSRFSSVGGSRFPVKKKNAI